MLTVYLTFIGTVNLVGTFLLIGAMSDAFADKLLRVWTAILPRDQPYKHSAYSRVWLWWAAIGTTWFGVINVWAMLSWAPEYQRYIAWGNVGAYFSFEALAIGGTFFSKRYGKGIYVTHLLWIGQASWGVVAALG